MNSFPWKGRRLKLTVDRLDWAVTLECGCGTSFSVERTATFGPPPEPPRDRHACPGCGTAYYLDIDSTISMHQVTEE